MIVLKKAFFFLGQDMAYLGCCDSLLRGMDMDPLVQGCPVPEESHFGEIGRRPPEMSHREAGMDRGCLRCVLWCVGNQGKLASV